MASRLSPDDVGLQLLENAAATAGALIGLILIFGAVSGAHFNPVVTLVDRLFGTITTRDTGLYVVAQIVGGCLGAIVANLMFELPAVEWSTTTRSSGALWLSEVVATVGLLLVIHGCVRTGRAGVVPFAVGLWIGGAYFFTTSTSFANPAVTIARTLSDTFAGIKPSSAPMFIVMQLLGAVLAFVLIRFLYPTETLSMHSPHCDQLPLAQQHLVSHATRSSSTSSPASSDPRPSSGSSPTPSTSSPRKPRSPPSRRCSPNASPATASTPSPRSKGCRSPTGRPSCSCASTTPAARRWPPAGCTTSPATGSPSTPAVPNRPIEINPAAIDAMAEVGIDITSEYPKPWTDEIVRAADVVVTMGCGDACPLFPGKRYEDWELDDPAGHDVAAVRPIRDEIRLRVEQLMASLGITAAHAGG